jgi:hypothetical protein
MRGAKILALCQGFGTVGENGGIEWGSARRKGGAMETRRDLPDSSKGTASSERVEG